jgi:hypothetical protein
MITTTIDETARTITLYSPAHTFHGNIRNVDVPAYTEVLGLDEPWVQGYRICRVCGKTVDADKLGRALNSHQKPLCSTDCYRVEELKRHACCEQAKPLSRNCVCAYATECPVHGERHFGTHD